MQYFDWVKGLRIPYIPYLREMTIEIPVAGEIEHLDYHTVIRVPLPRQNAEHGQMYLVKENKIPLWSRDFPVAVAKVVGINQTNRGADWAKVRLEVDQDSVIDTDLARFDVEIFQLRNILPQYDTVNLQSMWSWVQMIHDWKRDGRFPIRYKRPKQSSDVSIGIEMPYDTVVYKHYFKPMEAIIQFFGEYAPHGSGLNYDWNLTFKLVKDEMQCDITQNWDVMDDAGYERGSVGLRINTRHEGSLGHQWYMSDSYIDVDDDDDDRVLFANDAEEGVPDDEQDIWMYMVSDFKEVLEDVDMQLQAAADRFNRDSREKIRFTG